MSLFGSSRFFAPRQAGQSREVTVSLSEKVYDYLVQASGYESLEAAEKKLGAARQE